MVPSATWINKLGTDEDIETRKKTMGTAGAQVLEARTFRFVTMGNKINLGVDGDKLATKQTTGTLCERRVRGDIRPRHLDLYRI